MNSRMIAYTQNNTHTQTVLRQLTYLNRGSHCFDKILSSLVSRQHQTCKFFGLLFQVEGMQNMRDCGGKKRRSKLHSHSFCFFNTIQISYSNQIHCTNSNRKPHTKRSYNSNQTTQTQKQNTYPESTANRTNRANLPPLMKISQPFGRGRTHLHRPQQLPFFIYTKGYLY